MEDNAHPVDDFADEEEEDEYEDEDEEEEDNDHDGELLRRFFRAVGNSSGDDEEDEELRTDGSPVTERHDFDITQPLSHTYLFHDDAVDVVHLEPLDPDKTHILPYIYVSSVVVPGQTIPITRQCPFAASRLMEIIKDNSCMVLFANLDNSQGHDFEGALITDRFVPTVATIAKVVKYADQPALQQERGMAKCQMTGIYRCKVERIITRERTRCAVSILPDTILPPITSSGFLPRYCLMAKDRRQRTRMCSNLISQPEIMLRNRTLDNCERMIDRLKLWFSERNMRNILEMGEAVFSYYVTANISINLNQKYELLCENSTDRRIEELAYLVDKLEKVNCKTCKLLIYEVKDTVRMSADGFGNLYVNPGGHTHDLITTMKIYNIVPQGEPSSEFCWFPGYKWQILVCRGCYSHIGWEYTSHTLKPEKFYGITRYAVEHADFEENEEQVE